jgi:peroxiredoxin
VIHRKWVQVCLLVALFAISAGITMFTVERWARRESPPAEGSLEKIPGLSEGDWVKLPKLPSLERGEVDLRKTDQKYLLCIFISTECAGCSQDEPFWKTLRDEISDKQVAFYVIAVDAEQATVENFAEAYEFKDLPVLFDPQRQAIEAFKITFVPQYVLLEKDGRVLGRWNGIQRFDPKQSTAMGKLKGLGQRLSAPTK